MTQMRVKDDADRGGRRAGGTQIKAQHCFWMRRGQLGMELFWGGKRVLGEGIMEREIRDVRTYLVIGAAMKVHCRLGNGFLESVYQEALEAELKGRNVPFRREPRIAIDYLGKSLDSVYRPDFVVYDEVIIELKVVAELTDVHKRQVIHYLKATELRLALLLNFGASRLEHQRVINSAGRRPSL